jgi:hypothetical protein
VVKGAEPRNKGRDGVEALELEKEGPEVQVGDVILKIGNQKKQGALNKGLQEKEKQAPKSTDVPVDVAQGKVNNIFVRSYRSKSDDVQWANNGLVATVINGEAIPIVHNRIIDAGFADVVITPMGADKVFIRQEEGGDVKSIVAGAEDFFKLVFSNWISWVDDGRPYQRGAWVHLFGVPLSAWNTDFFKLCVFECGRFIRADSCSAEKDRLDFARVLIATTDLAIVSRVEQVLVDGVQVEIKIVEEWGYAMGEDTCLFEEESGSETSQSGGDEGHADPEVSHNADLLVDKITDVEEGDAGDNVQPQSGVKTPTVFVSTSGVNEEGGEWSGEVRSPVRSVAHLSLSEGTPGGVRKDDLAQALEPQASPTSRVQDGNDGAGVLKQSRSTRAMSCPPSEDRKGWPGPWSWEWLKDHNHEEAGVIFSASKRGKHGDLGGSRLQRGGHTDMCSRKAGGVLRHPVHSLKKIARLPGKDRGEALKALGRCVRRRRTGAQANSSDPANCLGSSEVSSASGSNDNEWRSWVAVHGDDQLALEDVRGIGQSIGVAFRGEREYV